jgi:hypothetical protein
MCVPAAPGDILEGVADANEEVGGELDTTFEAIRLGSGLSNTSSGGTDLQSLSTGSLLGPTNKAMEQLLQALNASSLSDLSPQRLGIIADVIMAYHTLRGSEPIEAGAVRETLLR